jgi:hypothetical protein
VKGATLTAVIGGVRSGRNLHKPVNIGRLRRPSSHSTEIRCRDRPVEERSEPIAESDQEEDVNHQPGRPRHKTAQMQFVAALRPTVAMLPLSKYCNSS